MKFNKEAAVIIVILNMFLAVWTFYLGYYLAASFFTMVATIVVIDGLNKRKGG